MIKHLAKAVREMKIQKCKHKNLHLLTEYKFKEDTIALYKCDDCKGVFKLIK